MEINLVAHAGLTLTILSSCSVSPAKNYSRRFEVLYDRRHLLCQDNKKEPGVYSLFRW